MARNYSFFGEEKKKEAGKSWYFHCEHKVEIFLDILMNDEYKLADHSKVECSNLINFLLTTPHLPPEKYYFIGQSPPCRDWNHELISDS